MPHRPPSSVALMCVAVLVALFAFTSTAAAASMATNPFSPQSAFNRLLPPNPPVASNGSSLRQPLGVAYAEYTPAVYVSQPGDPVYTIRLRNEGSWGENPLDGTRVRIDPRARPGAGADAHMTIVSPESDLVISLYHAAAGPSGSTWYADWGGMAPLSGTGANRRDSYGGRESGISQLAGLITPEDVQRGLAPGSDGTLGHALAFAHPEVSNRTYVSPAIVAGGNSSSSSALYMGQRIFLDPRLNVDSLPFEGDAQQRRFGRLVARTLQRWGAIVVTNAATSGFQLVNPVSWTSIGRPNPWPPLLGKDRSGYYNFTVRAIPPSALRAMAPSGGEGVALAPPPPPPPPPSPVATPAPAPTAAQPAEPRRPARRWAAVVSRRVVRSDRQVTVVLGVRARRPGHLRSALTRVDRPARRADRVGDRDRTLLRPGRVTKVVLRVRVPARAKRVRVRLVAKAIATRGGGSRLLSRHVLAARQRR